MFPLSDEIEINFRDGQRFGVQIALQLEGGIRRWRLMARLVGLEAKVKTFNFLMHILWCSGDA